MLSNVHNKFIVSVMLPSSSLFVWLVFNGTSTLNRSICATLSLNAHVHGHTKTRKLSTTLLAVLVDDYASLVLQFTVYCRLKLDILAIQRIFYVLLILVPVQLESLR